ncbi:hypothetical protein [Lentzea aerocolonigenes]|uniref:hypothetical protein n=1 Tax=Lentzea aerocolonigenes TaxID=68170 RepID=UPI0012DC84A4|nr:hypothetical protein [Lentzea aerocolonigenes]
MTSTAEIRGEYRLNKKIIKDVESLLNPEQSAKFRSHLTELRDSIHTALNAAENGSTGANIQVLPDRIADPEVRAAFDIVTTDMFRSVRQISDKEYALQAAIVSIVSAFEVFSVQVLSYFYGLHPSAISEDPQFSLKDAVSLGSIEKVIEQAANKAANSQMEKPFEDWISLLMQHTGMRIAKRPAEWPVQWRLLGQIFVVRNCLIHAGGNTDERYAARMKKYGIDAPGSGHAIELEQDNVVIAAGAALAVAAHIYFGMGKKQIGSDDDGQHHRRLREVLSDSISDIIRSGNAESIRPLAASFDFLASDVEPVDRLQVLLLTAVYLNGGPEQARTISSSLDWPNNDARLRIIEAAFKGAQDNLLDIIKDAVRSREIGMVEILSRAEFHVVRDVAGDSQLREITSTIIPNESQKGEAIPETVPAVIVEFSD